MNSTWIEVIAVAAGMLAGLVAGRLYFHGLWKSTHAALESERPVARMLLSFTARAALLGAGFVFAFYSALAAGLAMTAGFMVARHLAVRPVKKELECS